MRATNMNCKWTWRVTTPDGPVYVPNVDVIAAVRAAGVYGPESVQPATAEEHQTAAAGRHLVTG